MKLLMVEPGAMAPSDIVLVGTTDGSVFQRRIEGWPLPWPGQVAVAIDVETATVTHVCFSFWSKVQLKPLNRDSSIHIR